MKALRPLLIAIFLFACFSMTNSLSAQTNADKQPIMVQTTFQLSLDWKPGMTRNALDSLTNIYVEKAIKPNKYILNHNIMVHFWGHDNQNYIQQFEVANWGDVVNAENEMTRLFEAAYPNTTDRKAFWDAYNIYFTGQHSDEIYHVMGAGTSD